MIESRTSYLLSFLTATLVASWYGCSNSTSHVNSEAGNTTVGLGMERYLEEILEYTPASLKTRTTASKQLGKRVSVVEPVDNPHEGMTFEEINRQMMEGFLINEEASFNVIGLTRMFDDFIDELNRVVSRDNKPRQNHGIVRVKSNPDGVLTLPFLQTTVEIDYLVEFVGFDGYAGYTMNDTVQRVVTFSGTENDINLTYGEKSSDRVVYTQVLLEFTENGSKKKGWIVSVEIDKAQNRYQLSVTSNIDEAEMLMFSVELVVGTMPGHFFYRVYSDDSYGSDSTRSGAITLYSLNENSVIADSSIFRLIFPNVAQHHGDPLPDNLLAELDPIDDLTIDNVNMDLSGIDASDLTYMFDFVNTMKDRDFYVGDQTASSTENYNYRFFADKF